MATVFVFGSNKKGIHGAGAAKTAQVVYGAEIGVGKGRTGDAYAIPTKNTPTHDKRQLSLEEIDAEVSTFIQYAARHPEDTFLVTRIGCGLAGYTDEEIGPMFMNKLRTANIILPKEWTQWTDPWILHVDGTAIAEFKTEEEGRSWLDSQPDPFLITWGDEQLSVNKKDVCLCPEGYFNSL